MRRPAIVANWKMNKTVSEAADYIREFLRYTHKVDIEGADIIIAPPFTAIRSVADLLTGRNILLGAQNIYQAEDGSFTGEISARQIADLGCRYVILGHSERRRIFCETPDMINKKIAAALNYGIVPILCIGETLEERKSGRVSDVIGEQIDQALSSLPSSSIESCPIIAYEPVWAIGTGVTATAKEVAEAHRFIRKKTRAISGSSGTHIRILYGGSVTPENIGWIMAEPDVDGVLVGNASLKVESFAEIIKKSIECVK